MTATQTPLIETRHAGGFMVSEANGYRSRGQGVLASGAVALAGTVLGKIGEASAAAAVANGANTGNGTVSAPALLAGGGAGLYRVVFVAPTKFEVFDSTGVLLGKGTTGVAFATGLGFTITAGGTPFAAGDEFTINVVAGSGKFVPVDATGTDGREVAAAISWAPVDATSADKKLTTVERSCEVNASELEWPTGASGPQIAAWTAQLNKLGIIAR